jgi:hypothetical protein
MWMININVINLYHSWHQLFVVIKYTKHLLDNCLVSLNVEPVIYTAVTQFHCEQVNNTI